MSNVHAKNTVRYYLVAIIFLLFLFFSNDFGLIDVQKTAIVVAVGIDREEEEFIVTSQVAIPQVSKQGGAAKSVQLVSKGKTVAEAFEQINGKTGWYPKLVFCKLIILGESAANQNVFDGLDYFLRDEYFTDDCQLAVCAGSAKELLNTTALIDPSSSAAIGKVLSSHAERVGTVLPTSLKDFAIGYFGDSQSGYLPVVKKEEQQEKSSNEREGGEEKEKSSQGERGGESGNEGGGQGSDEERTGEKTGEDQPVFSARETALFVRGRWVETLTAEETFAVGATVGKLRLAGYVVDLNGENCSLSIKHNSPKITLKVGKEGKGILTVRLRLIAGVADYSKAQDIDELRDMGKIPDGAFAAAEKKLRASLVTAYEKARSVGCDIFGLQERLVKFKKRKFLANKDSILENTSIQVSVQLKGVR